MIQPNDASLEVMKKRFVELIGDRGGVFFEDKFYVRLPIAEEAAISLAIEWAAKEKGEQAMAFAEWARVSGWYGGEAYWRNDRTGQMFITNEELYTIFNNQQK